MSETNLTPKQIDAINTSPNDWVVCFILVIFLGFWGVHRFYVRKIGTGILMIFTFGGLGIWWFIDLILIATASFRDKEGRQIPYNNTPLVSPTSVNTANKSNKVEQNFNVNVASELRELSSLRDEGIITEQEFKKKKNLRVLAIKNMGEKENLLEIKNIDGGVLVQDKDTKQLTPDDLNIVTIKQPSLEDIETAIFTWKVLKHAKSNGILIAKNKTTIGLGAGQVSRVDAVHMALRKGGEKVKGGVLASDAFFPFRDSIDTIKGSGIRTIIQPGGSIRDQEVIDACNEHGFSMVFTGTRCFKH